MLTPMDSSKKLPFKRFLKHEEPATNNDIESIEDTRKFNIEQAMLELSQRVVELNGEITPAKIRRVKEKAAELFWWYFDWKRPAGTVVYEGGIDVVVNGKK
jgi:hypothetical protein